MTAAWPVIGVMPLIALLLPAQVKTLVSLGTETVLSSSGSKHIVKHLCLQPVSYIIFV